MPEHRVPKPVALNTGRGPVHAIHYSPDLYRLGVVFRDKESMEHYAQQVSFPTRASVEKGDLFRLSVTGFDEVHALLECLIKDRAITASLAEGMNEIEWNSPDRFIPAGLPLGSKNASIIRGVKPPFSHVIISPDSSRVMAVFHSLGQSKAAQDAHGQVLGEMLEQFGNIKCSADKTQRWATAETPEQIAKLLEILQRDGYIASPPAIEPHVIHSKEWQALDTLSMKFPLPDTPDAPVVAHLTFHESTSALKVFGVFAKLCEKIDTPTAKIGEVRVVSGMRCSLSHDLRSIDVSMPEPDRNIIELTQMFYDMGGALSLEGSQDLLAYALPQLRPTTHIAQASGLAAAFSTSRQMTI